MRESPDGLGEDELRQLIEGLPHPVWVRDRAGRFLLANRAFEAAFGAAGSDWPLDRCLGANGSSHAGETRSCEAALSLDGVATRWLLVRWPLHNGRGETLAWAGAATDVTRLRAGQRPAVAPRSPEAGAA
jgi:PAS domain-containing protein